MDAVQLVVAFRGITAILIVAGAIFVSKCGFQVYRDAPNAKGRLLMSLWALKVTSQGGGAVIMATAVGWVYLAYAISPHIDSQPGHQVVSVDTSGIRIASRDPAAISRDPKVLYELFGTALNSAQAKGPIAEIRGEKASIDPKSVRVVYSNGGDHWGLAATAQSRHFTGDVKFEAKVETDAVGFEARGESNLRKEQ